MIEPVQDYQKVETGLYFLTGELDGASIGQLVIFHGSLPLFTRVIDVTAKIIGSSAGQMFTAEDDRCTALIELALALQLKEWGVNADIVVGSGIGEQTAPCLAGEESVEEVVWRLWNLGSKSTNADTVTPVAFQSEPQNGRLVLTSIAEADTDYPFSAILFCGDGAKSKKVPNGALQLNILRPLEALGYWFVHGGGVRWEHIYAMPSCQGFNPGHYPFQRTRYWLEAEAEYPRGYEPEQEFNFTLGGVHDNNGRSTA